MTEDKKTKIWKGIIALVAVIVIVMYIALVRTLTAPKLIYAADVRLDTEKYPVNENWSVTSDNSRISTAEIGEDRKHRPALNVRFYETKPNYFILRDPEKNEYRFMIQWNEDFELVFKDCNETGCDY